MSRNHARNSKIMIAVDTSGSDLEVKVKNQGEFFRHRKVIPPVERAVSGVGKYLDLLAAREDPSLREVYIKLIGDESAIRAAAEKIGSDILTRMIDGSPRVEIVHAPSYFDDEGHAVGGKKEDTSLVKALELQKQGMVDGLFTAGNTACAVIQARAILGMLGYKGLFHKHHLSYPVIASPFPNLKNGFSLIVDAGSIVDPSPEEMVDAAVMACIYYEHVYHGPVSVGVLSNGIERFKGNTFTKAVLKKMRKDPYFSDRLFGYGFVEPQHVYEGKVNIVVADGFVGNIYLKAAEETARFMKSSLEHIITEERNTLKRYLAIAGYAAMKWVFEELHERTDPNRYGGALLLGLQEGYIVKGHGRTTDIGFKNGIVAVEDEVRNKVNEEICKHYHSGERITIPMAADSTKR